VPSTRYYLNPIPSIAVWITPLTKEVPPTSNTEAGKPMAPVFNPQVSRASPPVPSHLAIFDLAWGCILCMTWGRGRGVGLMTEKWPLLYTWFKTHVLLSAGKSQTQSWHREAQRHHPRRERPARQLRVLTPISSFTSSPLQLSKYQANSCPHPLSLPIFNADEAAMVAFSRCSPSRE